MSMIKIPVLILFLILPIAAKPKPNILWVFVEDLSPYMGCYDDPASIDWRRKGFFSSEHSYRRRFVQLLGQR